MPVLLAAFSIAGLLLAIRGTGIWHVFSWVTLCIPIYYMLKHGIKYFN